MAIPMEFTVEGIDFVNEYDVELGTESGDVHIEGKTKGTKMTMSKTEARKRHRKAVIHSNESTTPLTSESLLGITPSPQPLE